MFKKLEAGKAMKKKKVIISGYIDKNWDKDLSVDYDGKEPCFHYWHPLLYKHIGRKRDDRVKIIITFEEKR